MAIELIKEFDFLLLFREDRGILHEAFIQKQVLSVFRRLQPCKSMPAGPGELKAVPRICRVLNHAQFCEDYDIHGIIAAYKYL